MGFNGFELCEERNHSVDPEPEAESLEEFEESSIVARVAHMALVEFTRVKAHSEISLNECADQLVTRAAGGSSYCVPVEIPNGVESEEEFVMEDDGATRREDWSELEELPPMGTPAARRALATVHRSLTSSLSGSVGRFRQYASPGYR
jgi:hypothetical protein